MFKCLLLFSIFCLFSGGKIYSQNHVSWEFSYDKSSEKIIIKGTIDKGWHLYSQKTPVNAGPIPVSINIAKQKGLKLIGQFSEQLEPHEVFDVNFDSKVYHFEDSYFSVQKIKTKKPMQISGSINYMVCDDTRCLPPIDVPFSIPIK